MVRLDADFLTALPAPMRSAGEALALACGASRCSSGSVKPAVLPVPVWASAGAAATATTMLPLAVDFMADELRHTGGFATAMSRLPHYFTPFQAYVVAEAEKVCRRSWRNLWRLFQ